MKKLLLLSTALLLTAISFSQEVVKIQNGGSLTIQNGAALVLQGGLTLENGSHLINNGSLSLKNNFISNFSNWTDQSLSGALSGSGIVVFNSTKAQQFSGPTQFFTVYINTDQLLLNSDLSVSNLLRLIKGKINTGNYVVALISSAAASLENDGTNTGYTNSWINGHLRRAIATNTSNYDFPVGNSERSNLLQFINDNITGPSNLTASFGLKSGTDAGLNVTENGAVYTAVNNGGVWKLVPNIQATGGHYALQLYFNGFTGLADNSFGILRRTDESANAADWVVPAGSSVEPINGWGRKVSDGFARRSNISDFSQLGIGEFAPFATPCNITGASQVCTGSTHTIYAAPEGMTSYFWTVTGSAGIVGSNTQQKVSISAANTPGNFTLTLITTLNDIPAQCSRTITVGAVTECTITGADEFCTTPIPQTYAGPAQMSSYVWTITAGANIFGSNSSSSVSVLASVPGTYLLTLNASNGSGCSNQCTKTITVKPLPSCAIAGDEGVTAGSANNQYTAPANMHSYSWSISGNGAIRGSATDATVNVTAGAVGSFTLTLTTTSNGCSATCNKTVTVSTATPFACNIAGASEVCTGSAQNFYTAPANMNGYLWSVTGDGTIVGLPTNSSVNIKAGNTGNFTLTLQTQLNGASCISQKTVLVHACVSACSYSQGFYSNVKGMACNNSSGSKLSASQLMLNAFDGTQSKVFGSNANKRFFTLHRSDITSGTIYRLLPGGGNAAPIAIDKTPPIEGASYDDVKTWSLVPLQPNGPQKGRIRNALLAQTITLWFNLRNSSGLGIVSLANDTLITKATANCGSPLAMGEELKFGLPHDVIVYLNGDNGYEPAVNGLFLLANDVLGGVYTGISAAFVSEAVDVINNAFDGCRSLVGTIPYTAQILVSTRKRVKDTPVVNALKVTAYPNPYRNYFQLLITSPVTGTARIEFFDPQGQKVYELQSAVWGNMPTTVQYTGPGHFSTLLYRVTIKDQLATGIVLQPN